MKIREDYTRLNELCKTVDEAIANNILISFTCNLFMILIQLFQSIKWVNSCYVTLNVFVGFRPVFARSAFQSWYFKYSFGFLIARTAAICLVAAGVDTVGKEPTKILNSLCCSAYNVEVRNPKFLPKMSFFILGWQNSSRNQIRSTLAYRKKIF